MTGFADIAVAVLAAGKGERFGSDKLMADLESMPMGVHIGRTLASMDFGWRFAVCATDAPIGEQYAALGCSVIANPAPGIGQAHSLHLAVEAALATKARALLVLLADMPFVSVGHIQRIVQSGGLAASTHGTAAMPPALFPRIYWPQLLATTGDSGARALLTDAQLIYGSPSELRDIDVASDLPRPHSP